MKNKTINEIKELYINKAITDEIVESLRLDSRKGVQAILASYDKSKLREEELLEQFNKMNEIENKYRKQGHKLIAGVDEAGRGPLAGPVVAASVILKEDFKLIGLTDSKQLTAEKRQRFAEIIKAEAISYDISFVDHDFIDTYNIFEATKEAMKRSLLNLKIQPTHALIDAVELGNLPFSTEAIIKGDQLSISIAAASVLAKVARDDLMLEIDKEYPVYGFKRHMGYGTKEHLQMIASHGVTPFHRKSFGPVKQFINGGDK